MWKGRTYHQHSKKDVTPEIKIARINEGYQNQYVRTAREGKRI